MKDWKAVHAQHNILLSYFSFLQSYEESNIYYYVE